MSQGEKNTRQPAPVKRFKSKDVIQVRDEEGRLIWVHKSVDPDKLPQSRKWIFSDRVASSICRLVTEGHSLKAISEMEGYPPYHVIFRWKRRHPEFAEELALARKDQADFFAEKAINTADEVDADNVSKIQHKFTVYKWAASKRSPDEYGDRQKVVGDKNSPITFLIDTGVRLPGDDQTEGQLEIKPDHADPAGGKSA